MEQLEKLSKEINSIIEDYHCDENIYPCITAESICEWVCQFEEKDREFILSEMLHLLKQDIYISKKKAEELLLDLIVQLSDHYKYKNIESFLVETIFIDVQSEDKSQKILLQLLFDVIDKEFKINYNSLQKETIKNFIYIDDILASGGTFSNEIHKYINDNNLIEPIKNKDVKIICYFMCSHTWGENNSRYVIKNKFEGESLFLDNRLFPIISHYDIENNIKDHNQKMNLIYPQKSNSFFDEYINNLDKANRQEERAYRGENQPNEESFFTSKESRIRLEQIFLRKGIEIIEKISDQALKAKHRPLGKTYPSYKTFGTGTMFFTWRNISNTCPIVLWWNNQSHGWKGLFPLKNRGNQT